MATAKKSRGKAGSRAKKPMKKASKGGAKKSAKKMGLRPRRVAKKAAAKKAAPKKAAPKKTAKRAPAKKRAAATPTAESSNPLSRVARVAKEIAHQTTVAVSEGVDKVKEVSESIVERVTG